MLLKRPAGLKLIQLLPPGGGESCTYNNLVRLQRYQGSGGCPGAQKIQPETPAEGILGKT